MKNLLYITMITLFSFSIVSAGSYSDLSAAQRACFNAPSSRKAAACHEYNEMKQESGSSSELAASKRKCFNASWSRKAAGCYQYKKLKNAAAKLLKQKISQLNECIGKKTSNKARLQRERDKLLRQSKELSPTKKPN